MKKKVDHREEHHTDSLETQRQRMAQWSCVHREQVLFFFGREKVLPGEIFVKKRGSVSITTDQSTSCILGLNQPLAFVQRHQDAIMPWSKKNTERKEKKKPTRCQIKVSYDYERHQEGSGESHIFPGEAVVRPGAGNKKNMINVCADPRPGWGWHTHSASGCISTGLQRGVKVFCLQLWSILLLLHSDGCFRPDVSTLIYSAAKWLSRSRCSHPSVA